METPLVNWLDIGILDWQCRFVLEQGQLGFKRVDVYIEGVKFYGFGDVEQYRAFFR